jgi:hypothetical protein
MGQVRASLLTWHHVGPIAQSHMVRLRHTDCCGATDTSSHQRSSESRHVSHKPGATTAQNKTPHQFLFLPPLFLSSFILLYSPVSPLVILSSLPKFVPLVREIDFMSWYPNRVGYVYHLYHLILLFFEISIWMNSCVRD